MGKRLSGQVAVVTGAGRGIGRAEAMALAAEGARVVVNDFGTAIDGSGRGNGPADEVAAEIKRLGGEACANYADVTTPDGGENIIKTAMDKFGRLDILVNNAGNTRDRMIFNMSEAEWDSVIKVHLYGTFHCIKPACAIFRQQRSGRIINTSSEAAIGSIGRSNYGAAKEGIIGLTRTVARDMGKYGVTCNAIRPRAATRLTLNPVFKSGFAKEGPQVVSYQEMERAIPEMIAPFIVFLCTDAASNINGYDFVVGGGLIGLCSQPEIKASVREEGKIWSVDELIDILPKKVTGNLVNPATPNSNKLSDR